MTTHSAPDARPRSLHRRLTVALASAVDRARLAQVLAGDLPAVGTPGASPLIRSEDLWMAADGFAQLRAAERAEERSRLDAIAARITHDHETASSQLESLSTWRRTLLDGATWATDTDTALVEHHAAVEEARARLDERQHEQRAAHQNLQRVLEQRHAAAEAIEEADRELGDVSGLGMDESGLRRELEAAGRAVQEAEEAHRLAVAALDERHDEQMALLVRRGELDVATTPAPRAVVLDGAVEAVVQAIQALRTVSSGFDDVDPQAVALADAWRDLSADLAQLPPLDAAPSATDRDAAVARVEAAASALAEVDAAASALTPEERAELDAAHAELLEAEEHIGRRVGAASARKRLDRAREVERALLDRHGFPGYIDVVLTGGRSAAIDPRRPPLEREHFDAVAALEALDLAAQGGEERAHLESERERLLQHAIEVLGVDPGDRLLDLLRDHRQVPKELQRELMAALAGVDVRPVGLSLEAAAEAFLESHGISIDEAPAEAQWEAWPPLDLTADGPIDVVDQAAELAEVDAQLDAVRDAIEAAQSEVDRLAEELHLAQRSVVAFEGELSLRAGEDEVRMQRHAAAEQLRTQIEAVSESLERAEQAARTEISRAEQTLVSAEGDYDQAAAAVTELARQARKLAEELPIDRRPESDPLHTLRLLAERLRDHAEVLDPEVDRAEVAVATVSGQLQEALSAARGARAGADGPMAEDLVAGLEEIFERESPSTLLILDEPFVGVDHDVRLELLQSVITAGADRQIVLLTEDPEVLGWAIELPAEVASAMPADALLARIQRAIQGREAAPALDAIEDRDAPVDITEPAYALAEAAPSSAPDPDPDPDPEPTHDAPVARRWAGQR